MENQLPRRFENSIGTGDGKNGNRIIENDIEKNEGEQTGNGKQNFRRIKHDLMHEGLDWDHVLQYEEKIDELKKKALVPLDYSIHAPIQLIPERVIDTTNRSLVLEAQRDGFDPDGFRRGNPLQKDLFYLNPYITCSWCNAMNYVDVLQVRRMITFPPELKDQIKGESLPACDGCGRADGFEVGANDFMELIERRKREEEERKQRVLNSTITLQRMYRAHLRYMYGYAYNRKMLAKAKLIHRAASQIQAICRVRLARRIFSTEKCLVIIKNAHPRLLTQALEKKPGLKSTFWYRTPLEIKLLYEDYVNLCSRTGFQPPRLLVEKNIAELAKRILNRQNELISMIQKRWRGVMTRRIIKLFSIERIRLRQWYVSFLLKIQRCYRGHHVRLVLPRNKEERWRERVRNQYLNERMKQKEGNEKRREREQVKMLYQIARKDEFTCRVLNRIDDDPTPAPVTGGRGGERGRGGGAGGGGAGAGNTSPLSFQGFGGLSNSATEESYEDSPNKWYRNEYSNSSSHDNENENTHIGTSPRYGGGALVTRNQAETTPPPGPGPGQPLSRPLTTQSQSGGVIIKEKKKMILFSQSCYSSDHFKNTLTHFMDEELQTIQTEKHQRETQRQRKEFLISRVNEHGPRGYGRRGYTHSLKGIHALPDHLNHKIFLKSTPKQASCSSLSQDHSVGGQTLKRRREMTAKKVLMSVEPAEYRLQTSIRSKGMNCYHLQELSDIVNEEIQRATHEFQKVNIKEKIEIFTKQTVGNEEEMARKISTKSGSRVKGSRGAGGGGVGGISSSCSSGVSEGKRGGGGGGKHKYKYPVDVNVNPLQWLWDDIDTTIQYQDAQMKLQRLAQGGGSGGVSQKRKN